MFDEFVVTNVVSIDSENTTDMEELTDTEVSEFVGVEDETVGDVVSGSIPVVNPEDVVHWELKVLPAESFTPVVTRILYVVEEDKLDEGVTVKVLFELDTDGDEFIWIQVLKLSEDTLIVPAQFVSDVLVEK